MSKMISYPFFHDDVPVDISFVFSAEKPAGKHGFLQVAGRDFQFRDGTKVKFWGTNFNGAGCFPTHAYSKMVARRLAKIGINLVRMHQLDSQWHTPNIFRFTKGARVTDAHLDPESMDRLDYLIKCLKDEGIYVYMDMFTYRRFRSDEGVACADQLPDAAKPYCIFSRKLIELQKELATELWTHQNPYTGLAYCDEPAIVLAEIVNECDYFHVSKKTPAEYIEPYRTEFMEMFADWLKENGREKDLEGFNPARQDDDDLLDFKLAQQNAYYREITEYLRAIGVKIPVTGTNWYSPPDNLKSQLTTDFLDTHHYFYDWGWGEFEKKCQNKSITQEKKLYLNNGCMMAHAERPTYVSEWDAPWPNAYRADSVIYSAAFGMFQGWSGFAIHTYSYSTKLERMNILGKEINAEKIADVPYRQGIFSAWNDPAKFGLFYHAALLTRRGDVQVGKEMQTLTPVSRASWGVDRLVPVTEKHVTVASFDGSEGPVVEADETAVDVRSDTGELYRNFTDHYGYVDTEMTKCAFGMLEKNGEVALSGMKVRSKTDFAVIALSSLTDAPISSSDNILMTTVGRAENTDAKFFKEYMLELGKPPVLIENIEAEIELETVHEDLQVWAISPEGYYIGRVPTTYADGKLTMRVGEVSQSMYYLIVKP